MIRRVLLYCIEASCLVVAFKSGVLYQNQVGGSLCIQAEQEGVLAPLDIDAAMMEAIEGYSFLEGRQGIQPADAAFLDEQLRRHPATAFLSVDRSRLHECWAAWIFVQGARVLDDRLGGVNGDYCGPLYGFEEVRGVLTWPNSD